MKSFKIAIAQFSPHVGNLDANTQTMIDLANQAKKIMLILLFSLNFQL